MTDLYAPLGLKETSDPGIVRQSRDMDDPSVSHLLKLWDGLSDTSSQNVSMHEEHEREVTQEVEEETQIERPPKATPLRPSVDPRLPEFIAKGDLHCLMDMPTAYDAIIPTTSKQIVAGFRVWMHLRVTKDFARAVEQPRAGYCGNYLRPASWILTLKEAPECTLLLLISPYEANELLTKIMHHSSRVRLHAYEPRVAKSMSFVDVGPEPPPPSVEEWQNLGISLRRELNYFAGQLYFITQED